MEGGGRLFYHNILEIKISVMKEMYFHEAIIAPYN